MQVHIQNDGPVTISLETPPPKPAQQKQVRLSIKHFFIAGFYNQSTFSRNTKTHIGRSVFGHFRCFVWDPRLMMFSGNEALVFIVLGVHTEAFSA